MSVPLGDKSKEKDKDEKEHESSTSSSSDSDQTDQDEDGTYLLIYTCSFYSFVIDLKTNLDLNRSSSITGYLL